MDESGCFTFVQWILEKKNWLCSPTSIVFTTQYVPKLCLSLNSEIVCMYHSLCTHVRACSLVNAWVSALELTLLCCLNFFVSALFSTSWQRGVNMLRKTISQSCYIHMKVSLKSRIMQTNYSPTLFAFPPCMNVPNSPLCLQRFSRALLSFFSHWLSLPLHLLRAIFFSSACLEQNWQCKRLSAAKLLLCRQTHKVAHDKEQLTIHTHYESM